MTTLGLFADFPNNFGLYEFLAMGIGALVVVLLSFCLCMCICLWRGRQRKQEDDPGSGDQSAGRQGDKRRQVAGSSIQMVNLERKHSSYRSFSDGDGGGDGGDDG